MKFQAFILIAILGFTQLFAHRVLIMVDDNADGTITIETGLSSGGNAGGSKIILTDRASGRPLWQGIVPEDGVLTTKRPSVPYAVTLSMSEGHAITQSGPELLPIEIKSVTADSSLSDSTIALPADSTKDTVRTK